MPAGRRPPGLTLRQLLYFDDATWAGIVPGDGTIVALVGVAPKNDENQSLFAFLLYTEL